MAAGSPPCTRKAAVDSRRFASIRGYKLVLLLRVFFLASERGRIRRSCKLPSRLENFEIFNLSRTVDFGLIPLPGVAVAVPDLAR